MTSSPCGQVAFVPVQNRRLNSLGLAKNPNSPGSHLALPQFRAVGFFKGTLHGSGTGKSLPSFGELGAAGALGFEVVT